MRKKINILWFKRDLRETDHLPLMNALKSNLPILPLYIYEPEVEHNYDFAYRHWAFVHQSIRSMNIEVQEVYGNAQNIFELINREYDVHSVYSHEETGNAVTYKRDLDLKDYFKKQKIKWIEYPTNAIIRGARTRKDWDRNWATTVLQKIEKIDYKDNFFSTDILDELGHELLEKVNNKIYFSAGEASASQVLDDFLTNKIGSYLKYISYPEKSKYYSSILSPYISWGNITIRQIYQECYNRKETIRDKKSLSQFMARLKWHCHFIQNLESAPSIEFKNLNTTYDDIRNKKNKKYLKAWRNAQTGYPIIDAAMNCLKETGHINFRLRSTIVSFLTHHLWQPWQLGSGHLARLFIDYEPGIHFSQFQMQAGTIGIHTIRIYNPVKQSLEKDPQAEFIKKWIPALRKLPTKFAHEPWKMTQMEEMLYDFNLKDDYFERIVDHEKSAHEAREKLWALKKLPQTIQRSKKILRKHTRVQKRKFKKT